MLIDSNAPSVVPSKLPMVNPASMSAFWASVNDSPSNSGRAMRSGPFERTTANDPSRGNSLSAAVSWLTMMPTGTSSLNTSSPATTLSCTAAAATWASSKR